MITQEELKNELIYLPHTGEFYWLRSKQGRVIGEPIASRNFSFYKKARIDGNYYLLHRLAFLYMDGYFPEHFVDHINGNILDNRWLNLRHASRRCNAQNSTISSNNLTGFSGVCRDNKRKQFMAHGCVDRKFKNLGRYDTAIDAALARYTWEHQCPEWHCDARQKLHWQIKEAWPGFVGDLSCATESAK